MDILMTVWSYFATNILQQPAFMIGLIVMVGYILLGKPWYDTLGGTLKAIVGYLILTVGSGGLTNNFRPVLVGLKDRFNMDAMVIDPYFGQNAVTVGVEEVFGKGLWRCYDSSVYCIYCQHSSGTLYKVHKDACTFYYR